MSTVTSTDLIYAILSMDTYNRGYGANIGSSAGGLGELGKLGDIKIVNPLNYGRSQEIYNAWQSAGFYAVAYQWNGETIISYRGTSTESELEFLKDAKAWALKERPQAKTRLHS